MIILGRNRKQLQQPAVQQPSIQLEINNVLDRLQPRTILGRN